MRRRSPSRLSFGTMLAIVMVAVALGYKLFVDVLPAHLPADPVAIAPTYKPDAVEGALKLFDR